MLELIDADRGRAICPNKQSRIGCDGSSCFHVIEIQDRDSVLGSKRSEQSTLSHRPGSGQNHDGLFVEELAECFLKVSREQAMRGCGHGKLLGGR